MPIEQEQKREMLALCHIVRLHHFPMPCQIGSILKLNNSAGNRLVHIFIQNSNGPKIIDPKPGLTRKIRAKLLEPCFYLSINALISLIIISPKMQSPWKLTFVNNFLLERIIYRSFVCSAPFQQTSITFID